MEDDKLVEKDKKNKKKKGKSKSDHSCFFIEDGEGNFVAPCGCFPTSCCC